MHIQTRKSCLPIMTLLILVSVQSCRRTSLTHDSQTSRPANQSTAESSDRKALRTERDGMMLISGEKFLMGTEDGMPYEAPVHEVTVKTFWMDRHEVTVSEFANFVTAS